jgi:putative membrane protein
MMWWSHGPGWGGWIIMTVGMVAFWALVVVAIIALIPDGREDRSRSPGGAEQEDPLGVLDERFARDEISLEDYQARRAMLSKPGAKTW